VLLLPRCRPSLSLPWSTPPPRSVPATWELYVDMRFEQLRTACDLELWAEAFRSVEDIQGLLLMAPKGCKPRAALMATYYAKLTQIFTKSESRLYSAYAWYRWVGGWAGGPCC
jgi:translation initiation factor 3 subunit A